LSEESIRRKEKSNKSPSATPGKVSTPAAGKVIKSPRRDALSRTSKYGWAVIQEALETLGAFDVTSGVIPKDVLLQIENVDSSDYSHNKYEKPLRTISSTLHRKHLKSPEILGKTSSGHVKLYWICNELVE
jgi:hypothetical protein